MYESLEEEERELLHLAVFNVLEKDWAIAKESNINIISIASKIAVHAQAISKYIFAAEALLEAARESWKGYASDETLQFLLGVFNNLDKSENTDLKNKEKSIEVKLEALKLKSEVLELKGQWNECVKIYNSALELAENFSDNLNKKKYTALANATVGNIFRLLSDYKNALKVFEEALSSYNELGDKLKATDAIGNIGVINFNQGNYSKAMECYQSKLSICEELDDKRGIANVMGNMGNVFYAQGERNDSEVKAEIKNLYQNYGNYHKAVISYWLWKLSDNGDEKLKYREEALSLYDKLYTDSSNPEFKKQATELRNS
ncbi:unnamed protein product [Rotaria sp. Silwood1]|nr:unnamed protein product [Rotaria sp. Silwood1]